jgi:hypothetical protein
MKVLLQKFLSHSSLPLMVEFGGAEGTGAPVSASGFYDDLGGTCIGLLAVDAKLFMVCDGRVFEVMPETKVSHSRSGDVRSITIISGGNATTITYPRPADAVSTQFYSEEEEDADFGLWLQNVLGSTERRKTFLRTWSPGSNGELKV